MAKRKVRADGRYESTFSINGKKKHFYGSTLKEARRKRDDYIALMDRCPLANQRVGLGEWVSAWLETIKSDIAPTTLSSYTGLLGKHIIRSQIGSIALQDLTPSVFRSQWQRMIDKGMSPRTVAYVHTITSASLKQAVMDGLIPMDPLLYVRRPRQIRKEAKALTEMQIRELQQSIQDPLFLRIVNFALSTGMRRGEILGLPWEDVNFEKGQVSINQSVIRKDGKETISTSLKTASSRRTISIDSKTIDLLHIQKAYDMRMKLKSQNFSNLDLVFCREDGSPLRQNSVTLKMSRTFKSLGWEGFSFHSLRHTHATLLLKNGVHFKIVQYRLGHSTFQQTMDTYSHVTPEMESNVTSVTEKIL